MPKKKTPRKKKAAIYDITDVELDDVSVDEIEQRYSNNYFDAWKSQYAIAEVPTALKAAPFIADYPDVETFLWRYREAALKEFHDDSNYVWTPQYQKRGTCVGQGFKLGVDDVMAVNYLLEMSGFDGRAAVSSIYAGSRVDIAGKPGRWDGSNGSWASKWLIDYGVVLLKDMDLPDDSRDEDERIGLKWCSSRNGVPTDYEEIAKNRPVTRRLLVTKAREAGKLIQGGSPVVNCSNLIPGARRDAKGYSRVRRSGGHCTLFDAVRYNPFGLLYQNSWSGNWGSGPTYPDDQPAGSVWVNERDADAILSQGDSYALIGLTGLSELPSVLTP